VVYFGLLITLSASANGATTHKPRSPNARLGMHQHIIVRPMQGVNRAGALRAPGLDR
jgi:hypothetical protein